MRLYGSLTNRLMEGPATKTPEVGMGATILMYSDRHAATVVAIDKSGKGLWVQRDKATRTDKFGMSDSQDYSYEPDTDAPRQHYTLRKNGRWVRGGNTMNGETLALGYRDEHYDFSF